MKVLATYNIKGGVGKTASAVNLAYCAAADNLRVLLWDIDPQGAATFYFRIKPKIKQGIAELVNNKKVINKAIKATNYQGLDLLPADFSLRNMDILLYELKKPGLRFRKLFKLIEGDYDLLIIDCPPSISLVSENVFHAADALLVPTIPTHLSFNTYNQLKKHIAKQKDIQVSLFPYLYMYDQRKSIHQQFREKFKQDYDEGLNTVIRNSSLVEKMGNFRAPVFEFAGRSDVSGEFRNLWEEIWQRID